MSVSITLEHLGLGIDSPLAVPSSRAYRPPCWPPPRDWVCIEDKDGRAVARYGDPTWSLHAWCGKNVVLNFGDGPMLRRDSPVIDPANAELLRQLVVWRVWGPRGAASANTVINFFRPIRQIVAICSESNILAAELSKYPAVVDRVAKALAPSSYAQTIALLEMLRDARELLQFEVLDNAGIQRLKDAQPEHDTAQTEYIPPRIWIYVVNRLKQCIDDYLDNQERIEACFARCVQAYRENDALGHRDRTGRSDKNPFSSTRNPQSSALITLGRFTEMAVQFGISNLLERWIGPLNGRGIKGFSTYFTLVQYAALMDIAAFTMMRREEVASIRKQCLIWHEDEVFGRIPLIQGETTKTDPDNSALWVTTPTVESAVGALTSIAKMRLSSCDKWSEEDNPHLFDYAVEPWAKPVNAKLDARPSIGNISALSRITFPLLLDPKHLVMTPDDFKIAKAVCPSLDKERFQIGKAWILSWHQFRRTTAVNMLSDGSISDSTVQLQMKHMTRVMPLYYGRGNSTLHLNDEVRTLLVNAHYETIGRQLAEVHNTDRYVSPHGDTQKAKLLAPANDGATVNLITQGDAKLYEKAARQGLLSFRSTALGGCMKNGQCDGDCVSSVGDCTGGDGKAPCANVLYDRHRAETNRVRLAGVIHQLKSTKPDTPLLNHLMREKRGLENYFAHIESVA